MPLIRSGSKAAISKNISTEKHAHPSMPLKQAVAIAESVAREARKHDNDRGRGGPTVNPPAIGHVPWRVKAPPKIAMGPLVGTTTGRSDKIATTVPNGSHVLPADTIAAMGDGNSMAGLHHAQSLFPHSAAHMGTTHPAGHPFGGKGRSAGAFKQGGIAHHPHDLVDVNLSHGEFVVHPKDVLAIGGGDFKRGHEILDKFILHVRDKYQKKLKKLPGPVK
jgi:hypothetical protein